MRIVASLFLLLMMTISALFWWPLLVYVWSWWTG
jgi:hypothetical protein